MDSCPMTPADKECVFEMFDGLRGVVGSKLEEGVDPALVFSSLDMLVANVLASLVEPSTWSVAVDVHSQNVSELVEGYRRLSPKD